MKARLPLWRFCICAAGTFVASLAFVPNPEPAAQGADPQQARLFFSAWDGREKRYVADLKRDEIAVFEGGKQQVIDSLAPAHEEPLILGLLLDGSGSRRDQLQGAEREPAKQLFNRLITGSARGFVASFDSDIRAQTQPTENASTLGQAVDKILDLKPYGPSAAFSAMRVMADRLAQQGEPRRVLVVVCDGNDNASLGGPRESSEALQSHLKRLNIMLHQVVIEKGVRRRDWSRALHITQQLAEMTGGRRFVVSEEREMQQAFEQIADEIEQQYVVRYTVPAGELGKYRRTKLEATRPGVKLVAAPGYWR